MNNIIIELEAISKKYGDKGHGSDIIYNLGKLRGLIVELEKSDNKDAIVSKIDDFASDMYEEGEEAYAEEIWDAIADFRQSYYDD